MNPYWVETGSTSRMAIVPRPRGGDWLEEELAAIRQAGVDVLVSMLSADEARELGLSLEAEMSQSVGLRFENFPVTDRETPESTLAFRKFLDRLKGELRVGRSVAVHCRASIGRSSLLLASLLTLEGLPSPEAFRRLSVARGMKVPDTEEQVAWVERFASQF